MLTAGDIQSQGPDIHKAILSVKGLENILHRFNFSILPFFFMGKYLRNCVYFFQPTHLSELAITK